MKKKEKDYEYLETSPDLIERGLRRITRPKRLDNLSSASKKNRLTIYFDADIVSRFKKMSEREGIGYQTLMNDALRRIVDGMAENEKMQSLKEDLLKDRKFLKRLKTALTV
jgi:uncharacterized protein (DUF4415 family)